MKGYHAMQKNFFLGVLLFSPCVLYTSSQQETPIHSARSFHKLRDTQESLFPFLPTDSTSMNPSFSLNKSESMHPSSSSFERTATSSFYDEIARAVSTSLEQNRVAIGTQTENEFDATANRSITTPQLKLNLLKINELGCDGNTVALEAHIDVLFLTGKHLVDMEISELEAVLHNNLSQVSRDFISKIVNQRRFYNSADQYGLLDKQ